MIVVKYNNITAIIAVILTILSGIYVVKKVSKKEDVKILVAYHKKTPLHKDPYYVPIHVGRAIASLSTKDNHLSQDDLEWLKSNMIGDDTGDNISLINKGMGELSAAYWAWKNYNLLGKPKFIGLSHYRRTIKPDNEIKDFDIYIRESIKLSGEETNFTQYINSIGHRKEDIELAIKILKEKYPDYALSADEYLKSNRAYFNNLFIMKKDLFFEYCKWLFSILFEYKELVDFNEFKTLEGTLAPAFLSERLFGIFIHHKAKNGYKIKEVPVTYYDY